MKSIPRSFCNREQIARYYAKVAVRSLYREVALYPKPGLVSFVDSGGHQDMDGKVFFRSLLGLRHYFFHIAQYAIQEKPQGELVSLGKKAEDKMMAITKGVNTHKGAIFSLGIICASSAKLSSRKKEFTMEELQEIIVDDWSDYLKNNHPLENSHGKLVEEKYNISGAKGMAINGYRPVFKVFKELSNLVITDKTHYGLLAFKHLLLSVDDTNIIYRSGLEGLRYARMRLEKIIFLEDCQKAISEGVNLHKDFSAKRLSPGGVADMLGIIYFLKQIFSEGSI